MEMNKTQELKRYISFESSELSVEKKGDHAQVLRGYAAKFDKPSGELFRMASGITEIIRRGFFRDVLGTQSETIHALFNHDENIILGERNAQTMQLDEDAIGLPFEINIPDSQYIRDIVVGPIERGEITGCSWHGFVNLDAIEQVRDGTFELMAGGCTFLRDVGPVTNPAYVDTDVFARSVSAYLKTKQKKPEVPVIHNRSLELLRLKFEIGRN